MSDLKEKDVRYLCLSDDEICPDGYEGYIFPDEGYVISIEDLKKRGLQYTALKSQWDTDDKVVEAQEYYSKVIQDMMPLLAKEMNEYHGTDYSAASWYLMLGMWIEYFVGQLYDKYSHIESVTGLGYRYVCNTLDTSKVSPFYDYTQFIQTLCGSESYNKYLYSEIINYIKADQIEARSDGCFKADPVVRPKPNKKMAMRNGIYDSFFRFSHVITGKKDAVMLYNSFVPNKMVTKLSLSHLGRITNYITLNDRLYVEEKVEPDTSFRLKPNTYLKSTNGGFEAFLYDVIKKHLPFAYVELFASIRKRAEKIFHYSYDAKAAVYSATGVCANEYFKAFLMELRKTGKARLCVVQHGGNYGTDHIANNLAETRMSDIQYTWGWKENYDFDCECIPMPASKLIEERANVTVPEGNGDILYVGYTFPKHVVMFNRDAILFDDYHKAEIEFFKGLGDELLSRMRFRPYPDDFGRKNIRGEFKDVLGAAVFDTEKDYYVSLAKADLCVFSFFSTGFLEGINQNKPSIVYRKKGYTLDNAAGPIEELEKVGVICNEWDDVKKSMNEAIKDPKGWWNDEKRKAAVDNFKQHFAFRSDKEDQLWYDELMRLYNL